MQITNEELENFRKRYKKVFGVELSLTEASEAGNNLAELSLFLSQPLPSELKKRGTTPPKIDNPVPPSRA